MTSPDHTFAPVLEKAMPAVVAIRAKGAQDVEQLAILSNPIFSELLASDMLPSAAKQQGAKTFTSNGSGVIVDAAAGLVITNYHVVESATDIKVRLNDGREFTAELLGQDPAVDVAALRIKAHRLTAVPLGDSSETRIGDLVFAIGNPLGLDSTATLGMVSALRRTAVGYRNFEAYIQHDASVNSGNSGGALLNLRGELIGINTAIVSPSGGSVGLGFAVPIGAAQRIWSQLVKHGKVMRGHLGVKTTDMRTDLFDTYGLSTTQGAFILQTQAGSPAEQARLEFADVVTGFSMLHPITKQWVQLPIQRAAQLEAAIAVTQIGEAIQLEVKRGFETFTIPLKIADIRPIPETLEVPSSDSASGRCRGAADGFGQSDVWKGPRRRNHRDQARHAGGTRRTANGRCHGRDRPGPHSHGGRRRRTDEGQEGEIRHLHHARRQTPQDPVSALNRRTSIRERQPCPLDSMTRHEYVGSSETPCT